MRHEGTARGRRRQAASIRIADAGFEQQGAKAAFPSLFLFPSVRSSSCDGAILRDPCRSRRAEPVRPIRPVHSHFWMHRRCEYSTKIVCFSMSPPNRVIPLIRILSENIHKCLVINYLQQKSPFFQSSLIVPNQGESRIAIMSPNFTKWTNPYYISRDFDPESRDAIIPMEARRIPHPASTGSCPAKSLFAPPSISVYKKLIRKLPIQRPL